MKVAAGKALYSVGSAGGALESQCGHAAKSNTAILWVVSEHSAGSIGFSVRHSNDMFAKYCILSY